MALSLQAEETWIIICMRKLQSAIILDEELVLLLSTVAGNISSVLLLDFGEHTSYLALFYHLPTKSMKPQARSHHWLADSRIQRRLKEMLQWMLASWRCFAALTVNTLSMYIYICIHIYRRETWGETTTHHPLAMHPGRCIWHARGSSP